MSIIAMVSQKTTNNSAAAAVVTTGTTTMTYLVYQQIVIDALLRPKLLVSFSRIPFQETQIRNKRLLSWAKELVQNVSLWSQVLQSIMVGSARGIVV